MKNRVLLFSVMAVLLSLSFGPCNESLPTYQGPDKVFEATLRSSYDVMKTGNHLFIELKLRNIFDETLEARLALRGTIQITSLRDPGVTRTFRTADMILLQLPHFNPATGNAVFDPGDTIRIGVIWDFQDDAGRNLVEDFFRIVTDPQCKSRKMAYTEDFIISGELSIFEQTGTTKASSIMHSFCYVSGEPSDCGPFPYQINCPFRYPN